MTFRAFFWTRLSCLSPGGPGKEGIALLPVGDMLDHCHDRHMAWHTGADGKSPFTFITHHPISKARKSSLCLMVKSGLGVCDAKLRPFSSVYATCLQEAEGVRDCGLSAVPMLAVCFAGGCSIFKLWVQVKRGAHSGLRLHAGGQPSRLLSCQPWAACTG